MKKFLLPLMTLLLSITAAIGQTITGPGSACVGTYTLLTGSPGGGVWTCTAPGIITSAGVITATVAGTSFVTYTTGSGSAVVPFYVQSSSNFPWTGAEVALCGTFTLTATPAGGTWSSANPAVVIMNPTTGVMSGMNAPGASTTVSYTLPTGCFLTFSASVSPVSAYVSGIQTICLGNSTPFFTPMTGGGTWSSSTPAVATVSSGGMVTGVSLGTATIIYTPACGLGLTRVVTVTATATPGPITGPTSLCAGSTTTLSSTPSGGSWYSSAPAVANISISTGSLYGASAGTALITYVYAACTSGSVTAVATVGPPATCPGTLNICAGSTTTITCSPGATWSSASPRVTLTSSGVITGVSAGTAVLTFTTPGGCTGLDTVTVLAAPSAISGITSICAGNTTTLTASPAGGLWGSSASSVATVTAAGVVTGVAPGTATITYGLASGCSSSVVVTVGPAGSSCSSLSPLCVGSSTTLTCAGAGASWSTPGPNASITSSGVVTGLASGTAMLTYTTASGCTSSIPISVLTTPTIGGPVTICAGSTFTLSASPGGGTWGTASPSIATVSSAGVVTAVAPGTALITYGLTTGCSSSVVVTVGAAASGCSSLSPLCVGSSTTLTCAGAGATWSTSGPNASITSSGVATGLVSGTALLTYTMASGCSATVTLPIMMSPGPISGPSSICAGSTATLSTSISGASWSSSNPSVATVTSVPSGVVTGVAPGTTTITQTTTFGCSSSTVLTVVVGGITASATPVTCGSGYVLTAGGGTGAYSWSPASGLSCATCPTIIVNPSVTTTYVVSGTTSGGCAASATVIVGGANRIYGHIIFGMGMPSSPTCKVWLVQYNPLDSSITGLDSTLTCMDGGTPYYQFNGVAAGSYFVKAKLLSSVAGTSGYVPTYGSSTPNWHSATNIAHGSVGDVQNINMVYGTVPSGPGFISGYVYAGAGKGTADGAPVAGMLILLRNNTGTVLTHTYTDASGAYTFPGLANGSYVISPEEFDYYTTPSSILTLNASMPNVSGVNFKQYTNKGIITPLPIVVNSINNLVANNNIIVYPNPASNNVSVQWTNQESGSADVVITDVLGREVSRSKIMMTTASGEAQMNTHSLNAGVYSISIKTNNDIHTERLLIQK